MNRPSSMTRRSFLELSALGLVTAGCRTRDDVVPDEPWTVLAGTYTAETSEGVYRMTMARETGAIELVGLEAEAVNPSFLAVSADRRFFYAVNEIGDFEGNPTGAVSSFAIGADGSTLVNSQPTGGGSPCYVSLHPEGRHLLVANYGGGNVAAFPLEDEGRIAEASSIRQHEGSSINEARQKGPHAHCIIPDPSGRWALAADLGIDQVVVYRFDRAGGTLEPAGSGLLAPGAGPRHLAFHTSGRWVYVISELDSTVTTFAFDAETGVMEALAAVSTLPEGWSETSYCADVHVHPSGRFVYGSNRGHNSIAVLAVDPEAGTLQLVDTVPTGGEWPRNFVLSPDGRFLLAANQNTDSVVVFSIDSETGVPSETGSRVSLSRPVCLKFM